MFVRPLHSPSQNCLIESASIESLRNSNEEGSPLLLDKEKRLILTEGLKLEVQFNINSPFATLDSILRYSRGLQQWQHDVLYVEIRELLHYDEIEEKWKNIYDEAEEKWKNIYDTQQRNDQILDEFLSNQNSNSLFTLGNIALDDSCNVVTSLHVNVDNRKNRILEQGEYRLEIRFFQYGGSTSSVFLPFIITNQSLEFLIQHSSGIDMDAKSANNYKNENIPSQKQVSKIMTTVNPSKHYIHTVCLTGHDNWTKLHFNRSHHIHFDYSKHSSSSNHGKNYSMTYFHANSNQSTRQRFSNSVNLPIQTQRKSLESIASKKFSKNEYNSKKSVLLFVIGNGLDESKIPKGRVTILRPRKVVDPLTSVQMTAVQSQTENLLSLLNNAPFCPVIFYDLNNGRTVRVIDIQFALHFVYERARQKKDTSNVIILCTWTFRMHQRVETLENLFESVCNLPNVLFLSSAGNDGEDLQHSVVYPAICDSVLTVGSLDPNPELMNFNQIHMIQSGQHSDTTNTSPPVFRLNSDTNRGEAVNFYVRAESTSYAAIYSSVVFALMWLLDTNNEQQTLKDIFLNEACTWVHCSRTQRRILALTNANDAVRKLMGQQDEHQIGGILIESESDDESLEDIHSEAQRITIQGGVLLESADNESDDEELSSKHELDIQESGFHSIENDQISRSRNQYLHLLIKKMQHVQNSIFSSLGVYFDVTTDDIINGDKIDNISQKLQMKGNMNRVLLVGNESCGKTLRLYRLIVRVCEQSLDSSTNNTSNLNFSKANNKQLKQDSPLTPFYVSLSGIKRKDNIVDFIKDSFTPLQSNLWENLNNRLLVIDDFQESFNYDRDITRLAELEDVKIVLASTNGISNQELSSLFHIIEVEAPSLEDNAKDILFGKQTPQKTTLSEQDISRYVSSCKQHLPLLLRSTNSFSAFLSSELYRKQHNIPEQTSSGFVSKLLQKLSTSYYRYISVLEDLSHQFVESLSDDSLNNVEFNSSTGRLSISKKREMLKKCFFPVLSLFAFHVLQSPSPSFSEFVDPSKGKKYNFVFEIISRNINTCKFFSIIEGTQFRKRKNLQYRFSDPILMKLLASNYILTTFNDKCKNKDINSFYKMYYRQLYDPAFSDCLMLLRKTDSEFKKYLSIKGIDQLLTNSENLSESARKKKKQMESNQNISSSQGKTTSIGTQKQTEEILHKLESTTNSQAKQELILKVMDNSDHYDMYYSEKVVSQFISMLSVEKDSIIQQYLIKVICRLSSQCPDSIIQVVVRSIQVIAADISSEIRGFAIHQLKQFTTYSDKDQMMKFLLDLFKKEKDETIRCTILDAIGTLGSDRFTERKSIWFELGALDEESFRDEGLVKVSLLKTMSQLVNTQQHWSAILQKLRFMIRNKSISTSDALFIYNELASKIFTVDDLFTIADILQEYEPNRNDVSTPISHDQHDDTDSLLKLEMIRHLLLRSEDLQVQIAQLLEKSHNPSDESLQERLLDNLFGILKNGSNRSCQKAVDVMESLPNNFSQRDNILKRTAECIASGHAGQSVLAKRLIRLFDKFMDQNLETDSFWSCFVKLGFLVSDYDIDKTAHEVVLNIASRRCLKEIRIMLDELVRHLHECRDDTPHKESLKDLIQKLYHMLHTFRMK